MPRASTPSGRGGAGSSGPSTTGLTSSSVGTSRSSAIAGQPWSRFARASGHAFGDFRKDIARGLAIRCDWGPQYIADAWINEVKWLGITISPSYVGEPECNGVIERFMRTLKEQCLYLHRFQTLEEARQVIAAFIERYNHEWLIERLDYRTPAQARAEGWSAAA